MSSTIPGDQSPFFKEPFDEQLGSDVKKGKHTLNAHTSSIAKENLEPKSSDQKTELNLKNKVSLFKEGTPLTAQKINQHTQNTFFQTNSTQTVLKEQKSQGFFTQIKNIETMSRNQIAQFITELSESSHLFTSKEKKEIYVLINALKLLNQPNAFEMTHAETVAFKKHKLLLKEAGISLEAYDAATAKIRPTILQELKSKIKNNSSSLSTLSQVLTEFIDSLKEMAALERLEKSLPETFTGSLSVLGNKLTESMDSFQKFKTDLEDYCTQKWEEDLATFDDTSHGMVSLVVRQVSDFNMLKNWDMIEAKAEEKFLQFKSMKPKSLVNDICKQIYKQLYRSYEPKLQWLSLYGGYIKHVYSQGDDIHRNMVEGTCLINSIQRIKVLLRTPHLPSDQIELGSNQQGRMLQQFLNEEIKITQDDPNELRKLEVKFQTKLQAKLMDTYNIEPENNNQSVYEALIKQIGQLTKQDQSLWVLGLNDLSGASGHAINVQFDRERSIFRLIDDNIGIVECSDPKIFEKTLSSWLEVTYPMFPVIDLQTWKLN